jgi:hypothetical protein
VWDFGRDPQADILNNQRLCETFFEKFRALDASFDKDTA